MRIWTVHPRYLDAKGLVAAWREGLLAQKVLRGETRGYTRHPQLTRFRAQPEPVEVIAAYLDGLAREASRRGYRFDVSKIRTLRGIGFQPMVPGQKHRQDADATIKRFAGKLVETRGQLLFEWQHLKRKLRARTPQVYRECRGVACPSPHPLFRIVPGPVRDWEVSALPLRPAKGD